MGRRPCRPSMNSPGRRSPTWPRRRDSRGHDWLPAAFWAITVELGSVPTQSGRVTTRRTPRCPPRRISASYRMIVSQ